MSPTSSPTSGLLRPLAALLCVAGLIVAALAFAPGDAGAQPAQAAKHTQASAWVTTTLHYRFADEKCEHFAVGANADYNLGDQYVCRYAVQDHGKKIGRAGFDCGLISPEEGICGGSFDLPGGTIATMGRQIDGKVIPIVGGTGRYRGATGEWKYSTTSAKFVLDLLVPRAAGGIS